MAHFKTGCNTYYVHVEQDVQSKRDESVIFLST